MDASSDPATREGANYDCVAYLGEPPASEESIIVPYLPEGHNLSPKRSIQDIACAIENLIEKQVQGGNPTATLATIKNSILHHDEIDDDQTTRGLAPRKRARRTTEKKLVNLPASVLLFWCRIAILLDVLHEGLTSRVKLSQRELYYKLKTMDLFQSYATVTSSLNYISRMTRLTKSCLGVVITGRGLVCGRLVIRVQGGDLVFDCSRGDDYSIVGDTTTIESFRFECSAQFILVVEKETVYKKLKELNLVNLLPCIIVTGRGFPDMPTRCFLSQLVCANPSMDVWSLTDCNPDGIKIAALYKYGNEEQSQGNSVYRRYPVNKMRWLGLGPGDLQDLIDRGRPELSVPFTPRDERLVSRMEKLFERQKAGAADEAWLDQIRKMKDLKIKGDIEAIYNTVNMVDYVAEKIAQAGRVSYFNNI